MTLPHRRMIGAIIPPSAGNCNRKFAECAVFSGSRLAKDTVIGYTVKQPEGKCTWPGSEHETSTEDRGRAPVLRRPELLPADFIENLQLFHRLFLFFQRGCAIMLIISF